ncbi:MAG: FecR domain-containing protein [Bacteroidota bacterium]|nr:FecR domain-containing protein [Bacteroidota bacterium]
MKNKFKLLICCCLSFLWATNLFPQQNVNVVLISSAISLQKTITRLSGEISGYEKKIVKCQNTISNSEKIQKMATEKNNKEAYRISSEAISTSKQSISDCRNFISALTEKKKKYQASLNEVKKTIESNASLKTNAVLLNSRGQVSVIKPDGSQYKISSSQNPCLDAGDIISTSFDGFASFDFLEGRGSLTVGPGSKVKMSAEKDSTQVLDVMKGSVYSGILKADEYEKKLVDMYHNFSNDSLLKSISYYSSLSSDQWNRLAQKEVIRCLRKSKFETRTPNAICAVRGTKFTVRVESDNNTEVQVLEGKVEITPLNDKDAVFVTGGQIFLLNTKDIHPQIIQADTLNTKKWWNYEE